MEVRRPCLRMTSTTPDFSQTQCDDWQMIRHIQSDILKTSQRIKQLSLNDRQFEEILGTPVKSLDGIMPTTVKRGRDFDRCTVTDKSPSRRPRKEAKAALNKQSYVAVERSPQDRTSRTLRTVLTRLRDLPFLYAAFKRRNLSVREILANSSKGNNEAVLLQVLEFLDQLMNVEEERQRFTKHSNRGTQTPSSGTPMNISPITSRQTISPLVSASISPSRSPYTSTVCSPRANLHKSQFENFTSAMEKDCGVEEFISPIPTLCPNSYAKDDECLKLIDESEQMLATIQAQSERIANLNRQICSTMANSKKLLSQPMPRHSNATETTSPISETVDRRDLENPSDLRMSFFSSDLWAEL
mmetsp:Transcript_23081/g.41227  ORF Transcript_23081/g.41227 Transcript_23081/m.41227 type:complete len:357 (-) Transcript_23081:244-1314(-)